MELAHRKIARQFVTVFKRGMPLRFSITPAFKQSSSVKLIYLPAAPHLNGICWFRF